MTEWARADAPAMRSWAPSLNGKADDGYRLIGSELTDEDEAIFASPEMEQACQADAKIGIKVAS